MRSIVALLGIVVLGPVFAPSSAGATEGEQESPPAVAGESRIRRVTLYPDRALVTREAKLQVPAGPAAFTLKDLPAGVLSDSVRARLGDGTPARLRGIEVKTYAVSKVVGDRAKTLTADREKLTDQLRAVLDRLSAIATRREFILSIKAAVGQEASAAVLKEKPKIDDLRGTAAFIEDSLLEIAAKARQAEREKREAEEALRLVNDELKHLTGGAPLTKLSVTVALESAQAAAATLEISYIVVGTGWVPFYDIHASVERGEATILYYGQILQATGEDWSGVELSLSTAHPARSARMPELRPLAVGTLSGKGGDFKLAQMMDNNGLQRSWAQLDGIIKQQNDAVYVRRDLKCLELPNDLVEPQTSSYVFRIKMPETIPSDSSPHKVTIATSTFKCGVDRVATPKLSAHVYLKTQLHNTSDFPYMPGDMNIFLENDFIGSGTIEMVSPGERFEIFLGADEGVKVTRKLETRKVEAGTLQKAHYVYSIKVENFKAKSVKLSLIDQLPVSRDSDVEVMPDPELTAPTERSSEGRLTWELEIEPGKVREIRLGYRVYYPANKPVQGLE
jgi:uncharacterized protein (TIGR02231 family)